MKCQLTVATLYLILSTPAAAQTASNLRFDDQSEAEKFILKEVGVSVKVDQSVERVITNASQPLQPDQGNGMITRKRAGRPPIHDAAPGWMKGHQARLSSAPRPTVQPVFSAALIDPMPQHTGCKSVYRPTGFLSRQAERRRAAYFPAMIKAACAANIPVSLFDALIIQESKYNTFAVSSAGARGLTQLMPGTARYVGTKNSFSPAQNLRGGAKYLREQIDRFGLTPNALAAYNAGPGNVIKHGGIPPFRETKNYVRIIMATVQKLSVPRSQKPSRLVRAVGAEANEMPAGLRYGRAAELISYGF